MLLQSIVIRYRNVNINNCRCSRLFLGIVMAACLILEGLCCGSGVSSAGSTPGSSPFCLISFEQLKEMIDQGDAFDLVDLRSFQEYAAGHIPGAVSIPYGELSYRYGELNPGTKTVVYCSIGQTGYLAAQMLMRLGFGDLYTLIGGFFGWEYAVELSDGSRVI